MITMDLLAAEKFWILDPLYKALGTLLAWFYSVIPSYGMAILLLTLAVRIVTLPLTAKQARSQQQMQQLQPELKRLQAKYKHDKQKLQEEVMKFYKENHANPLGGCLPVLLQAPILIVLYRLIMGLSDEQGPKHLPSSSAMFEALKESGGTMASWGMDLAKSAAATSGTDKLPYLLLVALVVATGYYQQRQLTARISRENINPQMAMMTKIFPVMFGVISFSIPAGVVVYFFVSNIWQIGQQAVLFRNQPTPAGAGSKPGSGDGKAKGPAGSKGKAGATRKGKAGAPAKGRGQGAGSKGSARGAAGKRPGPKGGPAKGGPARGAPARGAGGKAGGGRAAGAKDGAAAKGAGGKGGPPAKGASRKGRMPPPRDDRVKGGPSPGGKGSAEGRAAMGALGARSDGASQPASKGQPPPKGQPPSKTEPPPPRGVGASTPSTAGRRKRKRRGRRGGNNGAAPGQGPVVRAGGTGNGSTQSGLSDAPSGTPGSSGDGEAADDVAPTLAPGDEGQKGNDTWSG